MTNLTRVAVLLLLATPASVLAQTPETPSHCARPTAFEIARSQALSARSGGYYAAQDMSVSFTPESWSSKGLGLTALALDTSGAMSWGVGPKWYRRLADGDDFSASVFAQVVGGTMDTAVTIAPRTSGRFIDSAIGGTVGYKDYTFGIEAHYSDAPRLAEGTQGRIGAMRGSRVMFRTGYRFKHYAVGAGPCAAFDAQLAEAKAKEAEAERVQSATTQPHVEFSFSANGPQHPYAEFPGLAFSAAQLFPKSPAWGWAALGEVDLSYVRKGWTAGARVYSRSQGLQEGRFGLAPYAQLLVGATAGGREGIINSDGGSTLQPGVGISIGGGHRAFVLQYDYRVVRGGVIRDDHMPGFTRSMSGKRISIGAVWRFDQR